MPFSLPTFNLTCDIVDGVTGVTRLTSPCNLAFGRRQNTIGASGTGTVGVPGPVMTLLLPALTDIRSDWQLVPPDIVQCPAGSFRLYRVFWVDDIGKGFANEHRVAYLIHDGVAPIPLP